jgi:hypothetical protein
MALQAWSPSGQAAMARSTAPCDLTCGDNPVGGSTIMAEELPDLEAADVSSQSSRPVTARGVAVAGVALVAISLAGAQVPQQLFGASATTGNVAVLADDDDWSQLQQEQDALQQSLQQTQQSEQAAEQQNEQAQQQALQDELQGQMVEQQAGQ